MKPYLIILYLFALVALGATADGLNRRKIQTWGHLFEALELLGCFSYAMIFGFDWYMFGFGMGSYVCIRVFAFDFIYNITAKNDLTYLSKDNWWGRTLSNWPPGPLLFARVIFLITGMAFVFNHLRKK